MAELSLYEQMEVDPPLEDIQMEVDPLDQNDEAMEID